MIEQKLAVDAGDDRVVEPVAAVEQLEDLAGRIDIVQIVELDHRPRLMLGHRDDHFVRQRADHLGPGDPGVLLDLAPDQGQVEIEDAGTDADVGGASDLLAR